MKKQKVLGVIPARLHSTRLPRKMLADIAGRPLIYHTWLHAKKARLLDEVLIATDSKEIYDTVLKFGAEVIMTPKSLQTGTDRVAYAAKGFKKWKPDIVVNIQGDEPLMPAHAINKTVAALIENAQVLMSTPATHLTDINDLNDPGVVKVVLDKNNDALYFSRYAIPFPRVTTKKYLKHIGMYAFRYNFLQTYVKLKQTFLEKTELLEQLRVLENGYKINVVVGSFDRIEVNTPDDLERVREKLEIRVT